MTIVDHLHQDQKIIPSLEHLEQKDPKEDNRERQMDLPPLSIIIPAYNEEAGVGAQIEVIRRVLCERAITHEIIVIDDGSVDQTADKATQACAQVLRAACIRHGPERAGRKRPTRRKVGRIGKKAAREAEGTGANRRERPVAVKDHALA